MAKNISILFARGSKIWREAVETDEIRQRLQDCALGKIEMTPCELTAAKLLLERTVPTLSSVQVEHSGEVGQRSIREQSDAELIDFITRSANFEQAHRIRASLARQERIALVHRGNDPEVETGEDPQSH